MDIKEIQDLIKFVAKSGVSEVELETKGVKLVIKTQTKTETVYATAPAVAPQIVSVPSVATPAIPTPTPASATPASPAPAASADDARYITIKSPMIGTFYRRPSPDKDLFVNVGDEIKPGKVLGIIEAMKLFNEIESEVSGRIIKILCDDSSPVEYDQPLFLIDPT